MEVRERTDIVFDERKSMNDKSRLSSCHGRDGSARRALSIMFAQYCTRPSADIPPYDKRIS